MANLFAGTVSGLTFSGDLIWTMSNFAVEDTAVKYIDSMELVHRSKFINKRTGFETTKHTIADTDSTAIYSDIAITFVGSLPRWLLSQLYQLAVGVNGAGMEILFRDNFWSYYQYSCRWSNAGEFVENSTLLGGAAMRLESWDRDSL